MPDNRFSHQATLAADSTSAPILVPDWVNLLTVAVFPSGTAKVQISLSSHADILGATANWVDWDSGSVAVDTISSIISPIKALRLVTVSDAADWEILA